MYRSKIALRHTAADAAGSPVWALHVPLQGSAEKKKRLYLREVLLRCSFDGTTATAHIGYDLIRFKGADPTNGTTIARTKARGGLDPDSIILDANIQQRSGILTLTGETAETGAFATLLVPAVQGDAAQLLLRWPREGPDAYVLEPGDGLSIRVAAGFAAIIGQSANGSVGWDERDVA